MPADKMDRYEIAAMRQAGNEAGQWLDSIGKTDLATLTKDEWEEFLGRIILRFGQEIKRELGSDEAPF